MTVRSTSSLPYSTMLRPPTLRHGSDSNDNLPANITAAIAATINRSVDVAIDQGGGKIAFGGSVTLGEGMDNSTTTPTLPHPQYYDPLYQSVAVTLSAIVFTVGFVGNVLVVIVIARTRSMHTTTNCYLLSLAVADCLVLLSGTLPAVPETFFRIDEWPFGRALCSILIYAQYVGVDASSLSITAFTIERYIAICHPIRAQTMCTVSRAKKITGGLWIFTVLYCGPWLGLTDLNVQRLSDGSLITKCLFRLARSSYLLLYMFDLVVFYILPFLISTVLYCLIGRILVLTSLRHGRDRPTRTPLERRTAEKKQRRQASRSDSRVQVIRMLVVVVLVFATLWMPYRVMVVYNSFAQHKFIDLWFLMFSRTLIYINCAINPILYNVMSVKFRRAFKNLLCCASAMAKQSNFGTANPPTFAAGLRPAGPPVFLYSEMNTEVSPFLYRTHHTSSRPQRGQGRQKHPLKVILLEWVKSSEKVKVQTSRQPCYGSSQKREMGRQREGKKETRREERVDNGGTVYLTASGCQEPETSLHEEEGKKRLDAEVDDVRTSTVLQDSSPNTATQDATFSTEAIVVESSC